MAPAVVLALMLAQTTAAEASDAAQLARIRKALAEAPAIDMSPATSADGPVFRVTIRQKRPVEPLWANWSAVPSNIRPWFRADHHEFLEQVLKNRERAEQFRGPTLYPAGIDMVQVGQSLAKRIKASNRKRQEQNAREEAARELAIFLACRIDPSKPGC